MNLLKCPDLKMRSPLVLYLVIIDQRYGHDTGSFWLYTGLSYSGVYRT